MSEQSTTPNSKPDAARWLDGEISLGRFIHNSSLESCYAQAADFAGGIANVMQEKIDALQKELELTKADAMKDV